MSGHHGSTRERRAPELLAPAGGPVAFRAAINNGADAVYAGLGKLNARRSAENFTADTLAEACRFAHLRGARVYLTTNVLVLPEEMHEALGLIDEAWSLGVDAVIVQDLGLLRSVRATMPHVRVHASTQVNAHNTPTIAELARLGVSRVTLGRETSVSEIARFVDGSPVEIESFVHGALCMCYSGQCLLSSLIGARSANRGMCAQPCRLPYELLDGSGRALAAEGAHLLSPKDLAGISILPDLVEAGVAALKIEGRMKSPEYVALVTGVYRAALDRAVEAASEFEVRDAEMTTLEEAFSRGFTTAYLGGERDNEIMSYSRPNNRGVLVGRVVTVAGSRATIAFDTAVESEDTIEVWTARGRLAQRVGALEYAEGEHATAPAGMRASIAVEGAIRPGDRVFRVANASLLSAARRTFAGEDSGPSLPLSFRVRLIKGAPLGVEVADELGHVGRAEGGRVEAARTKTVSAEEVMEHVGRLGSTPYEAANWDIDLSPGVGIGFSELHRVRRQAIEAFEADLLRPWAARRRARPDAPPTESPARRRPKSPRLVASVERADVARVALDAGVDAVHVPLWELTDAVREGLADLGDAVVPLVPRIIHDREVPGAMRRLERSRHIAVGNLGIFAELRREGTTLEAHWGLNAVNEWTTAVLAELGARFVWLSPELSGRQIAHVAGTARIPLGTAVYGRQEVMVTEHCILMAEGECSRDCPACERRASARFLRDRKGYKFPVMTDSHGRSHLFNAVPLDLVMELPGLLAAGVSAFRLDFTTESPDEVGRITRQVRSALDAAMAGEGRLEPVVQPATTGHYFRGVR